MVARRQKWYFFFFFFDMGAFSLQRYPGYREEKRRCEYLHQKLSHIKGLILEFEEKNRGSWNCQRALYPLSAQREMKEQNSYKLHRVQLSALLIAESMVASTRVLLDSWRSSIVAVFYFLEFGHSPKTPTARPRWLGRVVEAWLLHL